MKKLFFAAICLVVCMRDTSPKNPGKRGGGGRGGRVLPAQIVCNTYECIYIDSYLHRHRCINIDVYTSITYTRTHTVVYVVEYAATQKCYKNNV